MRDLIQNTKPLYDYNSKRKKEVATPLCNKIIKYYSKQIISGLLFLNKNSFAPLHKIHAGNIIMKRNKTICMITGFESIFYQDESNLLSNKNMEKIKQTYFIKSESDSSHLIKATNNFQLKKIIEALNFAQIVVEMSTGRVSNKKVSYRKFLIGPNQKYTMV